MSSSDMLSLSWEGIVFVELLWEEGASGVFAFVVSLSFVVVEMSSMWMVAVLSSVVGEMGLFILGFMGVVIVFGATV